MFKKKKRPNTLNRKYLNLILCSQRTQHEHGYEIFENIQQDPLSWVQIHVQIQSNPQVWNLFQMFIFKTVMCTEGFLENKMLFWALFKSREYTGSHRFIDSFNIWVGLNHFYLEIWANVESVFYQLRAAVSTWCLFNFFFFNFYWFKPCDRHHRVNIWRWLWGSRCSKDFLSTIMTTLVCKYQELLWFSTLFFR